MTGIAAVLLFLLLAASAIIPLRIALARWRQPRPQAILVLSGNPDRALFAAKFARDHPDLEIWYSGSWEARNDWKPFVAAGIARARVHMDDRATDTVTNFTTLVADFQRRGLRHLYLVTSDFHMRRAKWIADIVLGSRGIAVTPLRVPSDRPPESLPHALRDVARSFLWLATGHTGAFLNGQL